MLRLLPLFGVVAVAQNATGNGTDDADEATTAAPVTVDVKVVVPITMELGVSAADFNNPPANSAAFAVKKGLCGDATTPRGDLTEAYCEALIVASSTVFAGANTAAKESACLMATETACTAQAGRRLNAGRQLSSHGGAIKINGEHTSTVEPVGGTSAADLVNTASTAVATDNFKTSIATKTEAQVISSISSGSIAAALVALPGNVTFPGNATNLGNVVADTATAAVVTTPSNTSNAVVVSALSAIVMAAFAMLF